MEAVLPAEPDSLSRARNLLGAIADTPADLVENAKVVLTELLANEIKHGRYKQDRPLRCRIERRRSALRIEVSHEGAGFAMPAAPVEPRLEMRESGWGMALITRLSDRWGLNDAGDDRLVWAEIDLPNAARSAAGHHTR